MKEKYTKKFVENTGFICTKCKKIIVDGHRHENQEDLCEECKIKELEEKIFWLEQDIADYECVFAEVNKAFELVCKEFNEDKYEWRKKAEHELCGGENETGRISN